MDSVNFWGLFCIFGGAVMFGHLIYGLGARWPLKGVLCLGSLRVVALAFIIMGTILFSDIISSAILGHLSWYQNVWKTATPKPTQDFSLIEILCFVATCIFIYSYMYLPFYKKMRDKGYFSKKQ